MLPFGRTEREQFSTVSLLFALTYSMLLILGTLTMAFANFTLGFVLFILGLVLLSGNEYIIYQKLGRRAEFPSSPLELISGLMSFAVAAFIAPSALALYLFFFYGYGTHILVISIAGLTVTSVKIAARTAQLFLAK